jgi:hypothetical protein
MWIAIQEVISVEVALAAGDLRRANIVHRYNRWMNFQSPTFQHSLRETVSWCEMLGVVKNEADSEQRRRRILYEQSNEQLRDARASANRGWLRKKVTETKQWHQAMALLKQIRDSFGPLERRLRSDVLKPKFTLDEFGTDSLWAEAVAEVVAKRSQLLSQTRTPEPSIVQDSGRLLLFVPSETLFDGAAQHSSNGFFDVNNVPPWDIWVDFAERTLVCWVPNILADAAQMGIDVNPEECIHWAESEVTR